MSDIPKDLFVFLAILLIGAGAFMIGRISVGEIERKNELKILSPSSLSASLPGAQLGANSSTTGPQIDALESKSPRAFNELRHQVTSSLAKSGMYVGSKNGRVYHLPSCPGANRIKDENKVWFKDKHDAETQGYKPASNCKGI